MLHQLRDRQIKTKQVILGGIVLISMLCIMGIVSALEDNSSGVTRESISPEDIAPYQGPISADNPLYLSLIHISEPTRQAEISYAVFCLKKKKKNQLL